MGRKIAVNTRLLLSDKLEGIGTFTAEIFKILCKENPDDEFHFIFDRKFNEEFIFEENVIPHVIMPPARHPLLLKIWYDFRLPRLLKKIDPDIFISPDAVASLKTDIPSLTVIHDINFVHRPDDLPKKWSEYYNKYTPDFIEKSDRIATVSEYSKSDIIETYKVSPKKIDVVYNGVKTQFKPLPEEDTRIITDIYSKGKPFFFFIGSLHPRKNLKNLLLAFNEFKKMDEQDFKLIIGGEVMFKFESIQAVFDKLEFKNDVIFTGRLPDIDLNCFLSGATALTYVPFFEGFGIPVLEAMACGTAVITSDTTSLPEVVGDAAYMVSPNSISEISTAMLELSTNQKEVDELVIKGFERLKLFTWKKSADALAQSIEKTLVK
jgi:glycosyltransferase involved in cell wall biosynthesis